MVRGGGPCRLKAVKAGLIRAPVDHLAKVTPAARGVVPRAPEFPEKKRQVSYLVKCGVQVGQRLWRRVSAHVGAEGGWLCVGPAWNNLAGQDRG